MPTSGRTESTSQRQERSSAVPVLADKDARLRVQATRFIVSGGLAAAVDFGLLLALLHIGLFFAAAKTASFVVGTTIAYLINRRWTFKAPPHRARMLAVAALYAVMFCVQVGISTVLHAVLPSHVIWIFVAFVIAQGTATTVNFIVQRRVIFNLNSRLYRRGDDAR